MEILLTALSVVALFGCLLAYTRTQRVADDAAMWSRTSEKNAMALKAERDRITVLERELDALRRELRKLSGRFHASQREERIDADAEREAATCPECKGHGADPLSDNVNWLPCKTCNGTGERHPSSYPVAVCENWAVAKQEGPLSEAAKCDCLYCTTQRADRARVRRALVPKGAQATAATAKLNAGKP